jgi:hypothetical protein
MRKKMLYVYCYLTGIALGLSLAGIYYKMSLNRFSPISLSLACLKENDTADSRLRCFIVNDCLFDDRWPRTRIEVPNIKRTLVVSTKVMGKEELESFVNVSCERGEGEVIK